MSTPTPAQCVQVALSAVFHVRRRDERKKRTLRELVERATHHHGGSKRLFKRRVFAHLWALARFDQEIPEIESALALHLQRALDKSLPPDRRRKTAASYRGVLRGLELLPIPDRTRRREHERSLEKAYVDALQLPDYD